MSVIKVLGSLTFAISLLSGLVVILTVSTILESLHGTPFAQKVFYTSLWFDLFLSLVWVNIFCSTLTRFPFKKQHTGFVITHLGILMFLIGSLLSRALGVEGQTTLFEKEMKDRMLMQGYQLHIRDGQNPATAIQLKSWTSPGKTKPFTVPLRNKNVEVAVIKTMENAGEKTLLVEGTPSDPRNRAVEVRLASDTVGLDQTLRLIENDPMNPHASFTTLGPARIELKTEKSAAAAKSPVLRLSKENGPAWEIALDSEKPAARSLGDNGLRISDIRYIPHAKVVDHRLVNAPGEIRFNPAVEFKVSDDQGRSEEHTKFFLFADYPSLRGGEKRNIFNLRVELEAPMPDSAQGSSPSLVFHAAQDGSWTYAVASSKGKSEPKPLETGTDIPTGWMDMRFHVTQLFSRAKIERVVEKAKPNQASAEFAAQIRIRHRDGSSEERWLFPDMPIRVETPETTLTLSLKPKDFKLPFTLHLLDFRKVDYPGTANPSSFESDVILHDEKDGVTLERTIKMNEPLDYKGFRVFQASYVQDEELGEASVFSIAKNPGIGLIYTGSVIILIGVLFLFYLHPFFNGGRR